jgi:hypothetical protein
MAVYDSRAENHPLLETAKNLLQILGIDNTVYYIVY